jgi:hypothetical protein
MKKKKAKKAATPAEEILPLRGISGHSPPSIKNSPSPAVTPTFLKKALSKSEKKLNVVKRAKASLTPDGKQLTQSEPRNLQKKRKINFSLTKNQYQSVVDHSNSITESPDIPYRPDLKPKKALLKNKDDISIVKTPSPRFAAKLVQRNTAINSKSKAVHMLNRMRASDFF